jgi:hypothetical protein
MPTITIPQGANLSTLIDMLVAEEAQREEAQKVVDAIKENEEVLHEAILEALAATGVDRVSYAGRTAKREEKVIPSLKDWDSFTKFIHRNKYYHLVERRPAVLACRELLALKGKIPGIEPFVKVKLSFIKNPS